MTISQYYILFTGCPLHDKNNPHHHSHDTKEMVASRSQEDGALDMAQDKQEGEKGKIYGKIYYSASY